MKLLTKISLLALLLLIPINVYAGHNDPAITDEASSTLFSFIDLRDRESYVQATNTGSSSQTLHVQIFNVDLDCNENNFFDTYTPNDTHIYNMRDILTNDGSPSGVILPENTYGFVVITVIGTNGDIDFDEDVLIGNFRILDDAGYEYRTNSAGETRENQPSNSYTLNFSTKNDVSLSDVIFIAVGDDDDDDNFPEYTAGPDEAYWAVDVDIFDVNENPLSCRDVTFSCVDQDNPLLEQLLEDSNTTVAAFEYGINEAIPHSRDGELLCPGNIISEGWLELNGQNTRGDAKGYFIGLNNGNGRGSMDSMWRPNRFNAE